MRFEEPCTLKVIQAPGTAKRAAIGVEGNGLSISTIVAFIMERFGLGKARALAKIVISERVVEASQNHHTKTALRASTSHGKRTTAFRGSKNACGRSWHGDRHVKQA